MEWISVKTALPKATGAYIVSVKKESEQGAWVFDYVAWFYAPGEKWLRLDPFEENQLKRFQGDITSIVVGWLDNVPAFVG